MQPARDDSPASELQALGSNAETDLAPRTLPNGLLYCFEDSETEGDQDTCTADLEDLAYGSEADKARALAAIRLGIRRLELMQRPACRWYQVRCTLERRALQQEIEDAAAALRKRPPTG